MTARRPWPESLGPVAAAAGLAALVWALLAALPVPPTQERLAAKVLWRLSEETRTRTSADGTQRRCVRVTRWEERVEVGRRRPFAVVGLTARNPATEAELPVRVLREAYLAGCPRLLATTMGRRVRSGRGVNVLSRRLDGRDVFELVAPARPEEIGLLVDSRTLEPVAVRVGRGRPVPYLR